MHQIRFRPGLRPGPRWGSPQRSPRPPSRLGRGIPPPHSHPPRRLRRLDSHAFGVRLGAFGASLPAFRHFFFHSLTTVDEGAQSPGVPKMQWPPSINFILYSVVFAPFGVIWAICQAVRCDTACSLYSNIHVGALVILLFALITCDEASIAAKATQSGILWISV